jgi:hypothetical protein
VTAEAVWRRTSRRGKFDGDDDDDDDDDGDDEDDGDGGNDGCVVGDDISPSSSVSSSAATTTRRVVVVVVIVFVRFGRGAMEKANAVEGLAADRGMAMAAKRRMAAVAAIVASICRRRLWRRGGGGVAVHGMERRGNFGPLKISSSQKYSLSREVDTIILIDEKI